MKTTLRSVLLGAALLMSFAALAQMPRIDLNVGMFRIDTEVAADDASRRLGLMNRQAMLPQQGMLFVFNDAQRHCMWMRNTLIPLSVAFLDEQGKIINVEDMEPQTENNHCAARPAKYALEMNKGWFAQRGARPGTQIGGIDKAPRAH